MIDPQTISRILDSAQIVEVVSEFVTLRRRGANYVGLCPFHNDRTPSFYVSPAKGVCKCFACGKGGNVVHFIMEHEQLTYPEALRWLAKKYHIEIEERKLTDREKEAMNLRESLFVLNTFAGTFFQQALQSTDEGRRVGLAYFRSRGIRDDVVRRFQLGYCPSGGSAFAAEATRQGHGAELLSKAGLCYRREGGALADRFQGRVIFPWLNVSGRVVGFGGRVLDARTKGVSQKYVNSPESEVFSKRRELYGIYQAKAAMVRQDAVYMVEGYTDVLAMHQCGIENVVANSGTALSQQQIRLLHRFTSNITLLYDADEAGIKASMRGIDMLLAEGMNVKVLLLPEGEDPDSFSRRHTADSFRAFIGSHEQNFIRFQTGLLMKQSGSDPVRRAAMVTSLARSIALVPDEVLRYAYLKECAGLLQVDEQILQNEIRKHLTERDGRYLQQALPAKEETVPPVEQPLLSHEGAEQQVFFSKERLLVQMLVRYGEQVMCYVEDDSGQTLPLTVTECIRQSLDEDQLQLQHPLYRKVLDESVAHGAEPGFSARRYFLAHPDAEVSRLAAELIGEHYQLSKLHTRLQKLTPDEDQLYELVPHLLTDYKLAVLESEMKRTLQQLETRQDSGRTQDCIEVMKRYKYLSGRLRELARVAGDRVVMKGI